MLSARSTSDLAAMVLLLATALGLSVGCAGGSTQGEEPTQVDLVIRDVTVIDAGEGARAHQTVVIDSGRILQVLGSDARLPGAQTTLDGAGKFLIPGLWDMHVHVTYEPRLTAAMSDLFLSYGITSVRDTGGLLPNVKPVVERWRAAGAVAPRIYFSGPLLDGKKVVYDGDSRPEIGIANPSLEAAEQNVAALAAAGVDFVKVYELVSPDVFAALVKAARSRGLPIASHVPLSLRARTAGPLVDSMEHLRNIELDCASNATELWQERSRRILEESDISGYELRSALHAEQRPVAMANLDDGACDAVIQVLGDTIQVPTLRLNTFAKYPAFAREDWSIGVAGLPEPVRSEWSSAGDGATARMSPLLLRGADWSLELVRRLHQASVPIGAGTDTPIANAIPGYSLHTELERLVDAGLSNSEAIASATTIPARFFRIEANHGLIAADYVADLVLLDADPLLDIRNTRKINTVISKGRIVAAQEQ